MLGLAAAIRFPGESSVRCASCWGAVAELQIDATQLEISVSNTPPQNDVLLMNFLTFQDAKSIIRSYALTHVHVATCKVLFSSDRFLEYVRCISTVRSLSLWNEINERVFFYKKNP